MASVWGHGCGGITLGSSSLLGHKCLGRVLGFPGQSRPQPCASLVGGTLQPGKPGECWHGAAGAGVSSLPRVPSSPPRALPISCRQKKLRSPQPQEMQHKAERGNSKTMSSSLWTEPPQRHRALVPAGTLPGSVNVCACVHACVCVFVCHGLRWTCCGCPEGQQLAWGRAPGHWGRCAPSDLCHPHSPLVPHRGTKLKAKPQWPGSAPALLWHQLPELSPYTKIPSCSM